MAKDKVKKKNKNKQKQEKPLSVEFGSFRLTKEDHLNWVIERRNENGEFSGTKKRYYPKLSSAINSAFEKMILSENEKKKLSELMDTINQAKEELRRAIMGLKLCRPDIDID